MKPLGILGLLATIHLASGSTIARDPKIAVTPFVAHSPLLRDKIDHITAKFVGDLIDTEKFFVVPRVVVWRLEDQLASRLRTTDPHKIAPKLARSLRADWVFIPYATMQDGYTSLTVSAFSPQASEQSTSFGVSGGGGIKALYDELLPKLAEQAAQDARLIPIEKPPVGRFDGLSKEEASALHLAEIYQDRGMVDAALTQLKSISAQPVENPRALESCVDLYETLGNPNQAINIANRWLDGASVQHPKFRHMLTRKVDLEQQAATVKRAAQESGPVLDALKEAFRNGDLGLAAAAYHDLYAIDANHPALRGYRLRGEARGWRFGESGRKITVELSQGVEFRLARIPAGEFIMGSHEDEEHHSFDEGPVHWVFIEQPFYMGVYEVTQTQWASVMEENPSANRRSGAHPVENVSWDDSMEFCAILSAKASGDFRLPTEAEWEYACRAGSLDPYNYESMPRSKDPKQVLQNPGTRRVTVASSPNRWGIRGMHGNVWEWCRDVWHDGYEDAPWNGSPWLKGGDADRRVLRGGSGVHCPIGCRSANREKFLHDNRGPQIGLRVVLALPKVSAPGVASALQVPTGPLDEEGAQPTLTLRLKDADPEGHGVRHD
jgi:formylglycine-generating enzyme required for sulfatase activity